MTGSVEFHEWLRSELAKRGWSQAELARRAGIDSVNISNYVHREARVRIVPSERTCDRLADALELDRNFVRAMARRPLLDGQPVVAPSPLPSEMMAYIREFEAALLRLRSPSQRRVATRIAVDACNRLGELDVS